MARLYGREQSLSSSVVVIYFCHAADRGPVRSVCKSDASEWDPIIGDTANNKEFNYNKQA